jgi:electron transfer flavoprotein alpha subunit
MGIAIFSEHAELIKEVLSAANILVDRFGDSTVITFENNDFEKYGAKSIVTIEGPPEKVRLEDYMVQALLQYYERFKPEVILIGSTRRGKEIASRLAGKLDTGCVTDITGIKINDGNDGITVERFSYSGRTIAKEVINSSPVILSVMPRAFEPVEREGRGEVVAFDFTYNLKDSPGIEIVDKKTRESEAMELEKAEVILGVGRGIGGADKIKELEELKDLLNAEIGSTRPVAYDYGWLPESTMIGLSGKRAKPKLYIGIGVSGQIQHITGIMQAKTIVAINKDKEAPIFEYVDYGFVGDWKEIIPKMVEQLKKIR